MINLRYAIIGLSKKLLFTTIMILQLSVTFAFLYNIIYIKNDVYDTSEKVTSTFEKNNMFFIDSIYGIDEVMNKENTNFIKFYNYLKSNNDFIHCTAYEDHLLLEQFDGYEKFLLTNMYTPNKEGIVYYPIKALKVDYNYIKEFEYKITDGEILSKDDFNYSKEEIPILLGANYKNIFKVNDEFYYFDYNYGRKKVVVKGFLDEGYNFVEKNIDKTNIKNLDNYIIYPLEEPKIVNNEDSNGKYNAINSILQSVVIINSNDINEIVNSVKEEADKSFDDIQLTNVQDKLNQFVKKYQVEKDILTTMFIIIFSMCFIAIVTNMINSIKKRYKEFAIHLLNGASIHDIHIRLFYELTIIVFSGLMFAISIIKFMKFFSSVEITMKCISELILIAICIVIIILIITSLYLKRMSINKLLRRE
ncbi:MAG: hypothetical protein E7214_07455 [Clostridium sp.]|nr:hypothetical protein [Clostridium sp.]